MTKAPPVRRFPARRGFSLCALFRFFLKDEELAQNVIQNNDDDVRRELHHHVVPAEKINAQVHDEHIQKPRAEARAEFTPPFEGYDPFASLWNTQRRFVTYANSTLNTHATAVLNTVPQPSGCANSQ